MKNHPRGKVGHSQIDGELRPVSFDQVMDRVARPDIGMDLRGEDGRHAFHTNDPISDSEAFGGRCQRIYVENGTRQGRPVKSFVAAMELEVGGPKYEGEGSDCKQKRKCVAKPMEGEANHS